MKCRLLAFLIVFVTGIQLHGWNVDETAVDELSREELEDFTGWLAGLTATDIQDYLDEGKDINASTAEDLGFPALLIKFNPDASVLEAALEAGADVNYMIDGDSLMDLVAHGDIAAPALYEFASLLIKYGYRVDFDTFDPQVLLIQAIHEGAYWFVQEMLEEGMNPDVLYYDGRTLLQMAAGEGLLELAEILLAGGADLNNPDSRGWYPLMTAAAQDDGLEMVKLFVEAGADVNAAFDDDGTTVLALSAFNMNNPAITAYLLSMGADPLALNEDGHSALGYALAAEGLKEEIAQMLMDAGSPLTPFMFFGESLTTAIMFDEPDKVRFLIDHFTPDELVQRGSSPLKTAVFHEASLELIEELLRLEGVVHLREGNKGVTPLMAAAEKGDTELVRLFLDNGAKPMARTIEGETALHFAASRGGSEEAVRVLMDLDSSLSVKGLRDLLHGNQELRGTELFWEVNDRVYNRN